MKLRLSQILYLILAIPIALSPLFPITANASTVDGLTTDPLFAIPDSVDEFNLATSTTAQLAAPVEPGSWPMAAANPERTSWTPEEVRGQLHPEWYKPFEPYIPQKVQIIAAYDTLYISTANGLYALDADTGAEKWVFPTELPLGHSPTINNGVAYVGGLDRNLYAIDASTGQLIWSYAAQAGFETNPLVVNGTVFAGSRDGVFYAVDAATGNLSWRYQTAGPILYSAAYADNVIYFASNDSHAYALNASNGTLVWKSENLPGAGFYSWWPVIYQDRVIFSGSRYYRARDVEPGRMPPHFDVFPNHDVDPKGTLVGPPGNEPGDWVPNTPTIDTSKPNTTNNGDTIAITEYLEAHPWQRTYFVMDISTGDEVTYDFDSDGWSEYAPILWFGTYSGNRYPPVVGSDGVIYQANKYQSAPWLPGGHISGWKLDTPYISQITADWGAVDEPHAFSSGGDLIYWNLCCDREAGAIDISTPFTGSRDQSRDYYYFSYNLPDLIPGYDENIYSWDPYYRPYGGVYGGRNGYYGFHGDVNPLIPYKGKLYLHRGNSVIALSSTGGAAKLSTANIAPPGDTLPTPRSREDLLILLEAEIQKIIDAGHLMPGYIPGMAGFYSAINRFDRCGDDLGDYWHNPAETIYILLYALPHLSESTQTELRQYIQQEFNAYPPYNVNHIGWSEGVTRDPYQLTPEFQSSRPNFTSKSTNDNFVGWNLDPFTFYSLWKYAQEFGNAQQLFDISYQKLESPPSDEILREIPFVHNSFIAGYMGYLELEKMAGYAESTAVRNTLNTLLDKRVQYFTKDAPDRYFNENGYYYCRSLNIARNFLYLVPELAAHLQTSIPAQIEEAIQEYTGLAPLWFVSNSAVAFAEGVITHPYDTYAIFQAKALLLETGQDELQKFIDVPAVHRGDLYFLQNLVTALEAPSNTPVAPAPTIEPNGGVFNQPVDVMITVEAADAAIRYTQDGSIPTTSSPIYQSPITLYSSATIRARSFQNGYTPSSTTTATFILETTFDDVPFDHWAYVHIESLFQSGFVTGCSADPPLYCPERILERAESSVFILRGSYGAIPNPPYPDPSTPTFADVDPSFWGYGWIESLWQDGYTAGCSSDPLLFCPDNQHSRAEGSVFFLRIMNGVDYEPPSPQGIFADVAVDAWYAAWVEAAYNGGILPACNTDPLSFCPEDPLDRAWAAYMMVQAKGGMPAP